jgi:hypothetical protein
LNQSTFERLIAYFQFNFWLNLCLFEKFKTNNWINQLLSHKSRIFNSIFDCICLYFQYLKQKKSNQSTFESQIEHFQFNFWLYLSLFSIFKTKNWINQLLNDNSHIFNSISDWICIYLKNSKQKIESINFWTTNRAFSIQFLIVFAFISKIQIKKI